MQYLGNGLTISVYNYGLTSKNYRNEKYTK